MRLLSLLLAVACAEAAVEPAGPPPCGSLERGLNTLVPGPGRDGFDADLAEKARRHDRVFIAVHSRATGLNADFRIDDPSARQTLIDFARGEGVELAGIESLGVWEKSAGL